MKKIKLLLAASVAVLTLSSVAMCSQRFGPAKDGGWEESKGDEVTIITCLPRSSALREVEMAPLSKDIWTVFDFTAKKVRKNRFHRVDGIVPLWALVHIVKYLSLQEVWERLAFFCDGLTNKADQATLKITLLNAALEDRAPEKEATPDKALLRIKEGLRWYKSLTEEPCIAADTAIVKVDAIYSLPRRIAQRAEEQCAKEAQEALEERLAMARTVISVLRR